MSVGARLREARNREGLEVLELAFHAGVSPRTIERIEGDEVQPRKATLRVLGQVLDTDLQAEVEAA